MDERLSETRYPRERIATLDILRGIAILGILFHRVSTVRCPARVCAIMRCVSARRAIPLHER